MRAARLHLDRWWRLLSPPLDFLLLCVRLQAQVHEGPFPDMDKPEGDNPIETLTNFFKGLMPKDEEPAPPAPEDPAPESEDDAPAAE